MLSQILINSILSAILLSLVGIGFNLIFNSTKVFHLAHGAMYVVAVYAYYQFQMLIGQLISDELSIAFSLIFSLLIVCVITVLIERLVYLPLHEKNVNPTISLISSLGVYLLLVNLIAFSFGNESIALSNDYRIAFSNEWFRLTDAELLQIVVGFLILGMVYLFSRSRYYTNIRAVSYSPNVAEKFGVNVRKTRLVALIVGTVVTAMAGLLKASETAFDPNVGLSITLTATVAVIIGGVGSLRGTVIASFLIALLENYSVKFLSAQWKETLTYVLLIAVLLLYQQGLIAVKQRTETR